MNIYERLRTAREALPGTRTGSDADRLAGLQRLASATGGGTVLDVGCNDGIVDTFFAQSLAARCVGLDFYGPGLIACRAAAAAWPRTTGSFHRVDLTGGASAVAAALLGEPETFTTVLYLGVHHHLERQMQSDDARRLVYYLVSRVDRYFAIRAPAARIEDLASDLRDCGLERWYDDHSAVPRVNPLAVFARPTGRA